jgi:hypothetical protein
VGSPKLFASRAHEGHTSILSKITPSSSVVTRYGFVVRLVQRRQTNSIVDLLFDLKRDRALKQEKFFSDEREVLNADYSSNYKRQAKIL